MKSFPLRVSAIALMSAIFVLFSFSAALAQTQVSAADLNGTVVDPNGGGVGGATVTAKDSATGITRTVTSDPSRWGST